MTRRNRKIDVCFKIENVEKGRKIMKCNKNGIDNKRLIYDRLECWFSSILGVKPTVKPTSISFDYKNKR